MQFIKIGERLINLGTISYITRKGDTVYFAHNAMAENEHQDYGLTGNEAIAAYEFLRDTFAVTIPATEPSANEATGERVGMMPDTWYTKAGWRIEPRLDGWVVYDPDGLIVASPDELHNAQLYIDVQLARTATPQPATSTPGAESDSGATGERGYYLDSAMGVWQIHRENDDEVIQEFASDLRFDAERTTIALNTETASLRQQLALANAALDSTVADFMNAKLAAATSELASTKARVADMQDVIDDMRKQITREVGAHHNDVDKLNVNVKALEYSAKQALFWLNRAYNKSGNDNPTHEDIVEARGHLESIIDKDTD